MNKKIIPTILILTIIVPIGMFIHNNAQASIKYMDGKLIINGFVKETAFIRTDTIQC